MTTGRASPSGPSSRHFVAFALSAMSLWGCGAHPFTGNYRAPETSGDSRANETDPAVARLIPELRQYLLSDAELIKPTSASVSRADIDRDVAFLEIALHGSYGGYDRAESAGFSWSGTFAALRSSEAMPIDQWQARLVGAFAPLNDGHFAISRIDDQGRYTNWKDTIPKELFRFEAAADCASATDLSPYFENGALVQKAIRYSSTQPADDNCTWSAVSTIRVQRASEPTARALGGDVYLVNAHDFQSLRRDTAIWDTFRASLASVRTAKAVVVDLRGNTGGDDQEFYLWLNELYGRLLPTAVYERLTSPWTHVNFVNYFGEELARGHGDASWQEQMKSWRSASLDILAQVTQESLDQRDWDTWDRAAIVQEPSPSSPFSGQVVVLVDRYCASACELAVKTLRTIDGTTIVGEYTAGTAAIGNNGFRRLPGSNLKIQWGNWFERDLSVDSDNFREGQGFAPAVWLAPGSAESDDDLRKLVTACM